MPEIVYVLTNEAMPGMVKIGRTANLEERLKQLNTTGVPLPFDCAYAVEVEDSNRLEQSLHQLFQENRVHPKREFFRVAQERVVLALSIGQFKVVGVDETSLESAEDVAAVAKAIARRSRIHLEKLGIKIGDTLTFSRDITKTALVQADNRVLFDNQIRSLSESAAKILEAMSGKLTSVSGSDYWMFEGELLSERRNRLEAQ